MDTNSALYSEALTLLDEINYIGFGKYIPAEPGLGILRPQQYKAMRQILYSTFITKSKYIVLSAPTGCGKSLIAKVYARIMLKMKDYNSNIMTSNRELQKQYGADLKNDSLCKVIMGTNNYNCSFFVDEDRRSGNKQRFSVSKAPCQKQKNPFSTWWPSRKVAISREEGGIFSVHEDQDRKVLSKIKSVEFDVANDIAANTTLWSIAENEPHVDVYLKNMCKKKGACSYYVAREIAHESPVVIRSLQHLIFYILFKVGGNNPLLQQREVHIFDEFHTIESVFRDFLSVSISEFNYRDTLAKADPRPDATKAQNPFSHTHRFADAKKTNGKEWVTEDLESLCGHIENDLCRFVEEFILPIENEFREKPILNGKSFIIAAIKGEIAVDLESFSPEMKSVLKWYTNIAVANQERAKEKYMKNKGAKCSAAYGASFKEDKKNSELSVFPVFLDKAKKFFGMEHNLFMSATPIPKVVFEKMFDLKNQVSYIEVPSDFPAERSPIYFNPVDTITETRAREIGASLLNQDLFKDRFQKDRANSEAGWECLDQKIANEILKIVEFFPDFPGVVPCNSYKRVSGIRKYLEHNDRFIWVTEGFESKDKVAEFRQRAQKGEAPILVSASISEGHSFDDDLSRLQIIPKMPFPSIDGNMKILMNAYQKPYYESKTVATIQQMCGRSMRSKQDYCVTIVLDKKFEGIKNSMYKTLCTQHFMTCIQWDSHWDDYKIPKD